MMYRYLVLVLLVWSTGFVVSTIVFTSVAQDKSLCVADPITFHWQYSATTQLDMVDFMWNGSLFLTYSLKTNLTENKNMITMWETIEKTDVISVSQSETIITIKDMRTWDKGIYSIMLYIHGEAGVKSNPSSIAVYGGKDLMPTIYLDNTHKQLNTSVSFEELDTEFDITITTPHKLLANVTVLINGKLETECMQNRSCTYNGEKYSLPWDRSTVATIYLDYGFCDTIEVDLMLNVMPVPPNVDGPSSAEFTVVPSDRNLCVSDNATFHWKYSTNLEVIAAIFLLDRFHFFTYDLTHAKKHKQLSPANRTQIILANQRDIRIRINDMQTKDSGEYEVVLAGPSARHSHQIAVFNGWKTQRCLRHKHVDTEVAFHLCAVAVDVWLGFYH